MLDLLKAILGVVIKSPSAYLFIALVAVYIIKKTKTKKDDKIVEFILKAFSDTEILSFLKNKKINKLQEGLRLFASAYRKEYKKDPNEKTLLQVAQEFSKLALKDKIIQSGISKILKQEFKKKALKNK